MSMLRARARRWLAAAQEHRCAYCDRVMPKQSSPTNPAGPTLEHIVPRVLGGGDDLDNLVAVCRACNTFFSLVDSWCASVFGRNV